MRGAVVVLGLFAAGEVPPAYKLKRCAPLPPGHRYRLDVTHATLDFELAADGAPRRLASACRSP